MQKKIYFFYLITLFVSFTIIFLNTKGLPDSAINSIYIGWGIISTTGFIVIYHQQKRLLDLIISINKEYIEKPKRITDGVDVLKSLLYKTKETLRYYTKGYERANRLITNVINAMPEGIIITDENKKVMRYNKAASKYLTNLRENAPLSDITRNNDILNIIEQSSKETSAITTETKLDGKVVIITASRPKDTGFILLIFSDQGETNKYEKLRKEFAANVSHEFQSPLGIIKGNLETMESEMENASPDTREFIKSSLFHVNRLIKQVDELLEIARIESTSHELFKFEQVNCTKVIEDLINSYKPLASVKQQKINFDNQERNLIIKANRDLIEKAVSNLLDNAVKYTNEYGHINVSLTINNKKICLLITDDGPGIEKEHIKRIFERFYRGDRARSIKEGGTGPAPLPGQDKHFAQGAGLGLSIVKHAIEIHGGKVDVESEHGKGSTFKITLPHKLIIKR